MIFPEVVVMWVVVLKCRQRHLKGFSFGWVYFTSNEEEQGDSSPKSQHTQPQSHM